MGVEWVTRTVMIEQMQRVKRCQCDQCSHIEDTKRPEEGLPSGWVAVNKGSEGNLGNWIFCSYLCLIQWAAGAMSPVDYQHDIK